MLLCWVRVLYIVLNMLRFILDFDRLHLFLFSGLASFTCSSVLDGLH